MNKFTKNDKVILVELCEDDLMLSESYRPEPGIILEIVNSQGNGNEIYYECKYEDKDYYLWEHQLIKLPNSNQETK